jgi:hypothetical protein
VANIEVNMTTKTKPTGDRADEITVADIANTRDPYALLCKINPLLESDVDAPVRMHQALHSVADVMLCWNEDGSPWGSFEFREGLGWLVLTIARSMELHAAIVRELRHPTAPKLAEVPR